MGENDTLIPIGQTIEIGAKTYQIGRLTLKQSILLSRFVAKTILSSQDKLKSLKEKTEHSKSNTNDLMSILDLIDEKDANELFSIILKENDLQFLENNLDLQKSIEIIAVLCEQNNFESLKKNVMRIIEAINPKGKTLTH